MQPASSPGNPLRAARPADPRVQLGRIRFRRAVALMVMTLVLPGSAQLVTGNRQVGRVALRIWFVLLGTGVFLLLLGLLWPTFVFKIFIEWGLLRMLQLVLTALAIGWAGLFMDAWRLGQPLGMVRQQRLAVVGINGVLCFSVAGTLLFGAHLAGTGSSLLSIFGGGRASSATDGRYNVLLIGADTGTDRWGTRFDSLNVASIDENTGKTVLFGLPRNMMNYPFAPGSVMHKQFPNGFTCDAACLADGNEQGRHELNALTTWVGDHQGLFKGVPNPGIAATESAVEGITGLKINYYAMVDLAGFQKMVDAVGGITLNVRDRIPIGGVGAPITGWIKPGIRKLDGFHALWFARSRAAADDYSRMARQKCVMNAMVHQLNPQQVVLHFNKIAQASKAMLSTDLPKSEVDTFMELALKAKSQPIRTVSFVPPMIHTTHPDIAKIQAAVKKAIARSEGQKPKRKPSSGPGTTTRGTVPPPQPKPQGSTSGAVGSYATGYAANQANDLGAAC